MVETKPCAPVVSSPRKHLRFHSVESGLVPCKKKQGTLLVGPSLGANKEKERRLNELISERRLRIICIDLFDPHARIWKPSTDPQPAWSGKVVTNWKRVKP